MGRSGVRGRGGEENMGREWIGRLGSGVSSKSRRLEENIHRLQLK